MEMLTAAKAAAFAVKNRESLGKIVLIALLVAAGTVPPHHHEHDGTVICF